MNQVILINFNREINQRSGNTLYSRKSDGGMHVHAGS